MMAKKPDDAVVPIARFRWTAEDGAGNRGCSSPTGGRVDPFGIRHEPSVDLAGRPGRFGFCSSLDWR